MTLTAQLDDQRRTRVDARLRDEPIAWLTTVRRSGQPDTVPVWFLIRDDDTVVIYSRPDTQKLRNLAHNPRVSLALDGTAKGFDVVRLTGSAAVDEDEPPAHQVPAFTAKYADLIRAAGFGTAERFAEFFSVAVVVTAERLST